MEGGEFVCWYDYTNFNTWIAKYYYEATSSGQTNFNTVIAKYYEATVVVAVDNKSNCCRDIDRAMNTYIYSSQYTDPDSVTLSGAAYEPLPQKW